MGQKISVNDLGSVIQKELAAYSDQVSEGVRREVKAVSKETAAALKATSPRDTGKYAKGWTSKVEFESREDIRVLVYNRTEPQLTHLLEYGHAKVGGGRVEGRAHIRPAEEQAERKLEGAIKVVLK